MKSKCEHPIDWPCPVCHPGEVHPTTDTPKNGLKPRKDWSDKEEGRYQDGMEMVNDYLRAKGRL